MTESEVIFHRNERNDDTGNKARRHDDDKFWVVESYEARTTKAMIAAGAESIPTRVDGHLFKADGRQLIIFIAESSGIPVDFPTRKRATLSPEAIEARRLRGVELNRQQRVKT